MSEQEVTPQEEIELENFVNTLGVVSPGHQNDQAELTPEDAEYEIKNKLGQIRTQVFVWGNRDGREARFMREGTRRALVRLKDLYPEKENFLRKQVEKDAQSPKSPFAVYKESVDQVLGDEPKP